MADSSLQEVIEDAITVATYGQRSGKLADNSLFRAIQKAKGVRDFGWHSPEAVDLQTALNKAVKAIAPVTLADLTSGWDPFRTRRSGWKTYLFVLGSVLLIFISAYYTTVYRRAVEVLDEWVRIEQRQVDEIIESVFIPIANGKSERLLNDINGSGELSSLVFMEKIKEVRKINRRIGANLENTNEVLILFYPSELKRYYYSNQTRLNESEYSAKPSEYSVCHAPNQAEAKKLIVLAETAMEDPVEEETTSAIPPIAALRAAIEHVDETSLGVKCSLGLQSILSLDHVVLYAKQELQRIIELLGVWILPALYGALGAVIYHMRFVLDPLLPDPRPARVFHRVALGIFAGISVAWLWASPGAEEVAVGELSLSTFTIAFLLGFSIDVFFALLDRLVHLARDSVSRIGVGS